MKKRKIIFFGSILLFAFCLGLSKQNGKQGSFSSLTLKNVLALAWADSESGGWGGVYCADGCTTAPGDVCVQCGEGSTADESQTCDIFYNFNEFGYPVKCYIVN